jgi:hypothetical protein
LKISHLLQICGGKTILVNMHSRLRGIAECRHRLSATTTRMGLARRQMPAPTYVVAVAQVADSMSCTAG